MCILFVFVDSQPQKDGFRLILASNRDEFYRRPSKKAAMCAATQVIAGRDMEIGKENGSWLGASTKERCGEFKFRCGALLNLTGEQKPQANRGRGPIVVDFLEGSWTSIEYAANLSVINDEIHPYNFVSLEIGDKSVKVLHTSNSPGTKDALYEGKQILGFGNSSVNCPLKKVLVGREKFGDIVNKFNNISNLDALYQELLKLLKDKRQHLPDAELERRAPNWHKDLSSVFVEMKKEGYGTRTHTIIMVDYKWNYHFFEDTLQEPIDIGHPVWEHTVISNLIN